VNGSADEKSGKAAGRTKSFGRRSGEDQNRACGLLRKKRQVVSTGKRGETFFAPSLTTLHLPTGRTHRSPRIAYSAASVRHGRATHRPGSNGREIARGIPAFSPETHFLLNSGRHEGVQNSHSINARFTPFFLARIKNARTHDDQLPDGTLLPEIRPPWPLTSTNVAPIRASIRIGSGLALCVGSTTFVGGGSAASTRP
jgi:hypothetical protein